MRSSRRLQPVANLAKQGERSAARQHGDVLREFQQQQQQLEELIKYRNQYVEQFQQAGKAGLSIVQVRDYQLFLSRLDQAIAQQRQLVQQHQAASQQTQSNWMDKRGKSKMIDKVVENRELAEKQALEKREQREQEDRPNRVDAL